MTVKSFGCRPIKEWISDLFFQMPKKKVLFRVDGGNMKGLSFGHLARCVDLADALKEVMAVESMFLMTCCQEGYDYISQRGFKVKIAKNDKYLSQAIVEIIKGFDPAWIVIDLPYENLDWSFLEEAKKDRIKTIFMDDSRFISPGVDVILNSSIFAVEKTSKKNTIRYFLGPEYFIFNHQQFPKVRNEKSATNKILLSFGGADPAGLTVKVVESLVCAKYAKCKFEVVLGPGFFEEEKIMGIVSGNPYFSIHKNPKNIYSLFSEADLVVCAGGRTLYELVCMGVEAFPVSSISQETFVVEEFIKQNLIIDGMIDWDSRLFIRKFNSFLGKLDCRDNRM